MKIDAQKLRRRIWASPNFIFSAWNTLGPLDGPLERSTLQQLFFVTVVLVFCAMWSGPEDPRREVC